MSKSWTNDSYESIRFNESVQDVQDLFANQSKKKKKTITQKLSVKTLWINRPRITIQKESLDNQICIYIRR